MPCILSGNIFSSNILEEKFDLFPFQQSEMQALNAVLNQCYLYSNFLQTKFGLQGKDVRDAQITELDERIKSLKLQLTEKEKSR